MKAPFSFIFALLFSLVFAQNNRGRWTDLFSYANIKWLEEVNGVLYCGTDNGLFLYSPTQPDNEWVKYNKTNILNHVDLSAMVYDDQRDLLIIGYVNGSIDLLSSDGTQQILDIPWNNFSGSKKVNSIYIKGDYAFLAGDYGIVSFDLNRKEFVETTFFFDGGSYLKANKVLIKNDIIYVATNKGIRFYPLVNGVNFPNFYEWKHIDDTLNKDVQYLDLLEEQLYYITNNQLFRLLNDANSQSVDWLSDVTAFTVSNNQLIIAQVNRLSVFSSNSPIKHYEVLVNETDDNGQAVQNKMSFNAGLFYNNTLYGGSALYGLIDVLKPQNYLDNPKGLMPDGPYNNKVWTINAQNNKVWIAPGAIDSYNAPKSNQDGLSYFDGLKWNHISSNSLGNARDIVHIAIDPQDDNHFIASSFFDFTNYSGPIKQGLFEIVNKDGQFNITNIINPLPKLTRIAGSTIDEEGNVYVSLSFNNEGGSVSEKINNLAVRRGKNWSTFKRVNPLASTALAPYIGQNYIWIPQARAGGVAILDKKTNEVIDVMMKSNAELPDENVLSIGMDQSNTLWIGTAQGLVVLRGADAAVQSGALKAEPIVIMQAGLPEALLTNVRINTIEIDQANRKWIGTNTSGVYYFSENGEETILQFNEKNSPLPSDIIYDIKVDSSTGKVYFATEKGVVVYNGDVKEVGDDFSQALAYPNPVRPQYKGKVVIKGIPNRATVKITDVVGNLIYETQSAGGVAEWDTRNSKGKDVASGIYFVLMANQDGTETKTLKIAIIR